MVIEDHRPGKIRVANGFTWQEFDEGEIFDHSAGLSRSQDLIQSIVDKAWDAGFRPAGFSDVKNETAAIRSHLEDMRTVAFHKLGIKGQGG